MHKRFLFRAGVAALMALALSAGDVLAGTTGKILGVVRDAQTGEALPGANVVLEGTQRGATTDVNGFYTILLVDPGNYSMTASMIGYDAQQKTDIKIQSDFTTEVNFEIREASLQLGEMVVIAERPPVEPDRTTSKYIVGADEIENVPIVRSASEFIELQAGVSVDGDVSIRAGDSEDTAYYVDGIRIASTDHAGTRVYRDVNKSSIQELTVITGGMEAEYGNAQAGVVSFVTREGGQSYHGAVDYQFQPSGQKHWGANVYDSAIHRGNNQWDNPNWVGETVTLPDGSSVPAHRRLDYESKVGHFIEANVSGPISEDLTFFASSKYRKQAATFPNANLTTPFNTNTNLKIAYTASPTIKLRFGGFYDRREGINLGQEGSNPLEGGDMNIRLNGKNLFLTDPNPAGDRIDTDMLAYASITHSLSPKTFYELKLSLSTSKRDTSELGHGSSGSPETLTSPVGIKDAAGFYTIYRDVVDWERFSRQRLIIKGDLTSQVNKQHLIKTGIEATRYNNWWMQYESAGPTDRRVRWYSKTYNDIDFFPGQETKGVNPLEVGLYLQDKIEFEGMIVNAGIRFDAFFQNEWVTDVEAFYGGKSPMWKSMTRNQHVPTIEGGRISGFSPRVGISHPITSKSVIRFFYGKFIQFPNFQMMYRNEWQSQQAGDDDLNGNGTIDPAERWNAMNANTGLHHQEGLPPEETVNFESGFDWNFVSNYVASLTTYYKSAGNQLRQGTNQWVDPAAADFVQGQRSWAHGEWRNTRGFELGLKKTFSDFFSFNMGYNLQWAEQGRNTAHRTDVRPDSLFVANGHYWLDYSVDPTTGDEIPVPLTTAQIESFGKNANDAVRSRGRDIADQSHWSWIPWRSHYAAEGFDRGDGVLYKDEYRDEDREFWERVNSDPNYPGTGEGHLLVEHSQETGEITPLSRDRRAFGSMTFLFATPQSFGPWGGQALGNLRANMVYRIYTGERFAFTGLAKGIDSFEYGPMHTRTDLNVEKQFGTSSGGTFTFAVEVFNLFNQQDNRQDEGDTGDFDEVPVDMDEIRWQQYGISGLEPVSPDFLTYGEVNDLANYVDRPREVNFSLRFKW